MAGYLGFSIDIKFNDEEVMKKVALTQMALSQNSLGSYLKDKAVPYLQDQATERFANEGDYAAGFWAPLRRRTVDFRELQGFPGEHPINVRTGRLRSFVVNNKGLISGTGSGDDATLAWPAPSPNPITMKKYLTAQQGKKPSRANKGGKKGKGVVARPVVAVNSLDLYYLTSGAAQWIADKAELDLV